MLPRHQPPFSLREVLLAQARNRVATADAIEQRLAEVLGIPHAILLPSGRYGIRAGVQIALAPGTPVAAPALTCSVVHEAIVRAGAELVLLDCAEDSFLIDPSACGLAGLVMCELFGNTLPPESGDRARFCIRDMAMTVPARPLCGRLGQRELGVFSFGIGKALYSGGGGLAVTRDDSLAAELRRLVSNETGGSSPGNARTLLEVGARVVAHWPPLYSLVRGAKMRRENASEADRDLRVATGPNTGANGREWTSLPGEVERRLLGWAIEHMSRWEQTRLLQEQLYRTELAGIRGVALPPVSLGSLSHFTIRIPAEKRERVRGALWAAGVDAGMLFGFPRWADPATLPRARRVSMEVLNLPLGRGLTQRIVVRVGRVLRETLGGGPAVAEG